MLFTSSLAAFTLFAGALFGTGPAEGATPIRIGLVEAAGPSAEDLAEGAEAAMAEVNAAGGLHGSPLQLIRLARSRPWRDGASLMAHMLLQERLVALIGPTDGDAAHVAAQIATRRRVPVLTLAPEESLTGAMDPWVFRGVPDDFEQARALLRWASFGEKALSAAVVVPEGRGGSRRLASLKKACRSLGVELAVVIRVSDEVADGEGGAGLRSFKDADVLMLWLDPESALLYLRGFESTPVPLPILGSLRLDDQEFLKRLPPWTRDLALPMLRGDAESSLRAALGYDMVQAIADAAGRVGPEPALIRDALAAGRSLKGRSGTFGFGERGSRIGRIPIGILKQRRLVPTHTWSEETHGGRIESTQTVSIPPRMR